MKGTFPIQRFKGIATPFYYYDVAILEQTLDAIKQELAQHADYKVHYAVKANFNHNLLTIIGQNGFGADCVSGGEIRAALAAGIPASKIVFAGVGKSDWEIELGLENRIFCFNVESVPELHIINEMAAARNMVANIALRINPEVGAHTHANITTGLKENKFGISLEDLENVAEEAMQLPSINLIGVHFHIGSQITEMNDFMALCNRINEIQERLELRNIKVRHINVGGGLGVDYHYPNRHAIPDFKDYFGTYSRCLKLRPGQTLHFELGRSMVAQCGSLITRVLYVKEGNYKKFAIVDAGMTDLIRPALYQAYHKIENISSDEENETYDVVGPICESSDVFGKAIDLNRVKRGDFIAIRSAGAYGESMASGYNCRPLPTGYLSNKD